jgi:hypothetical protein
MFVKKILFTKIKFDSSVVAGIVSEADHYLHCSARDYLGLKGVLDIEILKRLMSLEGHVFSY